MKLMYEDFESLPKLVLKHIAEWLTQKVDCLTLETCAAPQEAEDEVGGAGHAAPFGHLPP